jgi:hypothetical protein
MLYLGDMDALYPMLRGCLFGMNLFDNTAEAQADTISSDVMAAT